jgi:hypothetical protein
MQSFVQISPGEGLRMPREREEVIGKRRYEIHLKVEEIHMCQ